MSTLTVAKALGVRFPIAVNSSLPAHVCINPDLIVGMELEIENVGNFDQAEEMVDSSIWKIEEDGSLRPQRLSWEFISHPLRMENMIAELEKFLTKNRFNVVNYSDRTSVHVHTNVTDFTQAQLATLCLTYTVFEDVIFEFINNFNKLDEQGFCRDTNIYCIPWTQCRMNAEFVRQLFANTNNAVRVWQKYTALNLLPVREHGTVEWRHMHGTNDLDKLKKWLNLIGSIMLFAKKTDFDDMEKTLQTLNDTSMYQQFFQTVLGDLLPFDDAYARCMSEGVTNAKFALMNKNKKSKSLLEQYAAAEIFPEAAGAWAERNPVIPPLPNPIDAQIAMQNELVEIQRQDRIARQAVQAAQQVRVDQRAARAPRAANRGVPPPARNFFGEPRVVLDDIFANHGNERNQF